MRIVVAHRLSTIRDADEIIVLDRGIVDRAFAVTHFFAAYWRLAVLE